MRSNQQNKRSRGRNTNNNNRRNSNPLTRGYESNGPDVRVRGTAAHVAEKYVQLSRDAHTSGDSVAAENYLQHAEHYFRIISAAQEQQQLQQAARVEQGDANRAKADAGQGGRQPSPGPVEASGADVSAPNANENDGVSTEVPTAQPSEPPATDGQPKPKRERRPRRRTRTNDTAPDRAEATPNVVAVQRDEPSPAVEAAADPTNAPQPAVDDLPPFVTLGQEVKSGE